jgi:hypothetical protein
MNLDVFGPRFFLDTNPNRAKPNLTKPTKITVDHIFAGTVGSPSSSPAHSDASSLHNFVNVEFDDGDSGRIHVDDIRLLPPDYPVTGETRAPLQACQIIFF